MHGVNVLDAASQDGPSGVATPAWWHRERVTKSIGALWAKLIESDEMNELAVEREDATQRGVTEPERIRRHRVEHRLDVGRRAGDHTQDFAGSGLPLQRLLCLVEQPHVLNGDDRLVSEGLNQRDLQGGEFADLGAP